jgi:hypothetical protein
LIASGWSPLGLYSDIKLKGIYAIYDFGFLIDDLRGAR